MWVIAIVICLAILSIAWIRIVRRYPPGPFPLPLIGNLHHILLAQKIHQTGIVELMKIWRKEYGNVITFWLGPLPTVHILDLETAKEEMLSNGAAYTERYAPYMFELKRAGRGTVFSSGDFWADHRRFTLRTLRDFAFKNSIMEERIMDELQLNFSKIEKNLVNGKTTIKANELFDCIVGSVINRIIFSEGFTEENMAEFFGVKHRFDDLLTNATTLDMSLKKWTLNMPVLSKRWKAIIEPQEDLLKFLEKRIIQRKDDIASGKHEIHGDGNDFVDAFFVKMERDRKEGRSESQSYNTTDV